jgi:hypothetical protein
MWIVKTIVVDRFGAKTTEIIEVSDQHTASIKRDFQIDKWFKRIVSDKEPDCFFYFKRNGAKFEINLEMINFIMDMTNKFELPERKCEFSIECYELK